MFALSDARRDGVLSLDVIGVAMGMVTVPMALLSVASVAALLWLMVSGGGLLVAIAIVAFAAGLGLALVFERVCILLDAQAWTTLKRDGRGAGMAVGIVSSTLPMMALLAWQYACFIGVAQGAGDHPFARWLLSYGLATGPWTLVAVRIGSDRRTLCGIRAYAGHLGYWLLSTLALGAGLPAGIAALAMPLPALLPLIVGTLLAVADRDSLKNVRI
jgi:hypothetical protein